MLMQIRQLSQPDQSCSGRSGTPSQPDQSCSGKSGDQANKGNLGEVYNLAMAPEDLKNAYLTLPLNSQGSV